MAEHKMDQAQQMGIQSLPAREYYFAPGGLVWRKIRSVLRFRRHDLTWSGTFARPSAWRDCHCYVVWPRAVQHALEQMIPVAYLPRNPLDSRSSPGRDGRGMPSVKPCNLRAP